MHGGQWARSPGGLVAVLSDGGLSGISAMPLGIHSWKSGKVSTIASLGHFNAPSKTKIFAKDSSLLFFYWKQRLIRGRLASLQDLPLVSDLSREETRYCEQSVDAHWHGLRGNVPVASE